MAPTLVEGVLDFFFCRFNGLEIKVNLKIIILINGYVIIGPHLRRVLYGSHIN